MKHSKEFLAILANDPILKQIVENTELSPLAESNKDLYLSLTEAILSQQLSNKAAETIIKRFKALFHNNYPDAQKLIAIDTEKLRSAGVSAQKAGYLKSLATFQTEKGIDYELLNKWSDEEIIAYLLPIKGVGRWTVEMMLIFSLHRPNVFPIDDLVVRQKTIKAYHLTETGKELKKRLLEVAETWSPFKSLVSRYLWRGNIEY